MLPLTMRQKLTDLTRDPHKSPGTIVRLTSRGKPSLVVMSAKLYDSIVETLDVMSEPEAIEALRGGLADIGAGRVRSLDEVARRLGLGPAAPGKKIRRPPRKNK